MHLKSEPFILIMVVALTVGTGGVMYYEHIANEEVSSRITVLESQLSVLASAISQSGALTEENRLALKELANRSNVVARSQDDLLTAAVAKASPAVVSVVIKKDVPKLEVTYVNPFGDDPFFGDVGIRVPQYRQIGTEKQQVGAGTGFIVRSDGFIVTNRHVAADTEAEYVVLLSSGEQKPARVIHRDDANDIAVLKIDGGGYPAVVLGESSGVKLGQTVAAIGNALGEYSNTVSVGIVSGLDRTIQAADESGRVETLTGVMQTDAAINRGNSGGPLLDLSGSVIGVNVAVDQSGTNIGFAIPVNVVKTVLSRVLP